MSDLKTHEWHKYQHKLGFVCLSIISFSKTCEKPDGEPVKDLNGRDEAEAEAEATKSTDVGDEFETSHLLGSLVLWAASIVESVSNCKHLPNTVESPKKRFNTAMSRS